MHLKRCKKNRHAARSRFAGSFMMDQKNPLRTGSALPHPQETGKDRLRVHTSDLFVLILPDFARKITLQFLYIRVFALFSTQIAPA